jgi:hypothetical protein
MTGPAHLRHVTGWLADLANHTSGMAPLIDAKAKIGSMAATLADAFPEQACFSRESLVAIAKQNNFFPGFGTLHAQLAAWWSEHRPLKYTAPADLATAPLSAEDRANVSVWLQHRAANDLPEPAMIARLAIIRRFAPAGYRWLTNNDLFAADLAVRSGWTESNPGQDWEDAETVRTAAERYAGDPIALALLRGLVAKWAPENLNLIPEASPKPPDTSKPPTSIRPAALTTAQLVAAYDAAPAGTRPAATLRAQTAAAAGADPPSQPSIEASP